VNGIAANRDYPHVADALERRIERASLPSGEAFAESQ